MAKLVSTNEHFLQPEFKNSESGLKVYIIYSKVSHNVISKEAKKHQKLYYERCSSSWFEMIAELIVCLTIESHRCGSRSLLGCC